MNIDIKTADGADIELGGTYYDGRGTEYRAVGVRLVDYRHITDVSLSCLTGKIDKLCCVSMRPNELYSNPPDSWEKLEEDLRRTMGKSDAICAYFECENGDCVACRLNKESFKAIPYCNPCLAFKDILERIRKLRGED